jgi:2-dehydro-3-deoxyphosphooctonate aldolase (KDO 8-P synthase)
MINDRACSVAGVSVGVGRPLYWIMGPCVLETLDGALVIARHLSELSIRMNIPVMFKASFDKANRTSGRSFRGPGLKDGLAMLAEIRKQTGLPVTTDVHECYQAEAAGSVVNMIQIPAFLARQTDLVLTAAKSGVPVNIKKGQFMAPWDMRNVVAKVREVENGGILLTERGSSFGYNTLVSDMRAIPWMQDLGVPVIFDATHSVQMPGGGGDKTSGDRRMVPILAASAVAAGCDGLFLETHPHPESSPSDGPNMVPMDRLEDLIRCCLAIRHATETNPVPLLTGSSR